MHSPAVKTFEEARKLDFSRSTPLTLACTKGAIDRMQDAAREVLSDLESPYVDIALSDPRIYLRADEFGSFVKQFSPAPDSSIERFRDFLGKRRAYRGICLEENSPTIEQLKHNILLSRTAAKRGLGESFKQEAEQNWLYGLVGRLHHLGTNYENSGFVLSVADFPEPQILASLFRLVPGKNKAHLIAGDVPNFNLLNIKISDVYPSIKFFKHAPKVPVPDDHSRAYEGCYFDAADAGTERFALNYIPISDASIKTFNTCKEVYDFCEPFRQKMEKERQK